MPSVVFEIPAVCYWKVGQCSRRAAAPAAYVVLSYLLFGVKWMECVVRVLKQFPPYRHAHAQVYTYV